MKYRIVNIVGDDYLKILGESTHVVALKMFTSDGRPCPKKRLSLKLPNDSFQPFIHWEQVFRHCLPPVRLGSSSLPLLLRAQ